jgi:hypothetical protein
MMVVEPHFSSFNNGTSVAVSSASNSATYALQNLNLKYRKKYKQRPGRDARSVVAFSSASSSPSRISNPGRRSDSPPY